MFVPKLVTTLRGYDRAQLVRDLTAGVIVGIVALPLSIAFAIASGVTPDRGLYTAIVAGFLISALGGSRVQVGGPTGAFVVIVYGIVQRYGVGGLTVATLMAGVMLVAFGVAKLGVAIRFIPRPLVTGFTSGIAVIIASGEIKDFLGLRMGAVPAPFVEKLAAIGAHLGTVNGRAFGVALLALAILILWPRVSHRVPGPLVALLVTTAVVRGFGLDVETIGSRFGAISASLPHPVMPHLTFAEAASLVGPAFTIALLGGIESLLSAVVADGMIGGQHRSNMELVAQGVANVASALFGGIPATGAIARTATNVKNGGRTPVAGMVHAATLLLITLFFGRWAGLVPMATLASILLVVAYHMSEWRVFRNELSSPRGDVAVMLVAFLLTVLVDLTVAIEVGMVLAAFLFMKRMAEVTQVRAVAVAGGPSDDPDADEAPDPDATGHYRVPRGVEVYEINGPFFFGAAAAFKDTLARVAGKPKVLVLRMRRVPTIDATGLHALTDVVHRSRRDGSLVLLSEVQPQPLQALQRSVVLDEIGEEHLCPTLKDALTAAEEHIAARRLLHGTGRHAAVT
ncbi:sulfate transporter [Gemmatirosa kalamazoonensis]|uniref:Sulfate transporter n=1 Tax=Gemmatirosa kalamazoonensis TaxID=861299 RepID=W0RFA8_9BACT|nr:sulfate permease [Gemmatirosa kalamazoonensis]AHG89481.1 sulfate transporter [Gemmatirosa kalamazoonensis]